MITIKPLTPGLCADYFDLFEKRAFTDDSPYRCYCQIHQMTKEQAKATLDNADGRDWGRISREIAERQITEDILRGYLAYADGKSIGWCNAKDRANYPAEPYRDGVLFHAPAKAKEKVLVCFSSLPSTAGRVLRPSPCIGSSPTPRPKTILLWSDSLS